MIDVAFRGADIRPAATAVVIDVLRATTTITMALASGYERVLVAGGLDQARALRADGRVLAGEHKCERPPDFDLGNSPEETAPPRGAELILATTNGAPAIVGAVAVCDEVLVACLANEDAVVEALASRAGDILIVCAGTNGDATVEDTYLAGRLSARLEAPKTDAALIAEAVAAAYPGPIDALDVSAGATQLYIVGLGADVTFCAQESITSVVPRVTRTIGNTAVLEAQPETEHMLEESVPASGSIDAAGIGAEKQHP
ncbi:MAG: 2-phosphosulfolactate phosphatase [Solirubrobacteraceae bacterium]|nr:2-phosphosulfolactate phosphatase [Solirubrobacteraceae bacterium]